MLLVCVRLLFDGAGVYLYMHILTFEMLFAVINAI